MLVVELSVSECVLRMQFGSGPPFWRRCT
jgi:hypothetical protein